MPSQKPHILYAVPPREGHMRPALQIANHLTTKNFQVTVLGTPNWRAPIEAAGATWAPIIGLWNHLDDPTRWPKIVHAIVNIGTPLAGLKARLDDGFVSLIPSGLESTRAALEGIARRAGGGGGTRVVVLSDVCFSGTLGLKLGTDLPAGLGDIRTVGIGVVPVFWASEVRPPWGWGLPFEDTPEARRRNLEAYAEAWDQEAEERGRMVLDILNCPRPLETVYEKIGGVSGQADDKGEKKEEVLRHPFWDASTICHDVTLQMCLPSLEYPCDDFPSNIKFAGTLPLKPLPADLVYPPWFETEVRSRPAGKKVILVAQGTEVLDHNQLLIPTIRGLAGSENILVIAVLCVKGATLDFPDGALPPNVRVVDYFPYDAILAHADLFVSNSGYGGFSHAVANGVPMVQTGKDFDKPDIGRRVEWSGLGVYLDSPPPSPEEVRKAVERVLGDDMYRRRARELREESEKYDPLGTVEKTIMGLEW